MRLGDQELVALGKHNWLAAVVGILLTAVPMLWFNRWLQRQGEAEALIVAARALGLAELRIGQARAVLDDLLRKRVNSCQPAHLEALRQSVFVSAPIKEIALVGPNGQTLCAASAPPAAGREVLASATTPSGDLMLDVVRIGDRQERMLQVRRLARSRPHLAALIPAGLLLPQLASDGGGAGGLVRMTLADGTLIGAVGSAPPANSEPGTRIVTRQHSGRYGVSVDVMLAHEGVIAGYDDLRRIGTVASGVIALLLLGLAVVVPWRRRRNPFSEIARALLNGEFIPYYQPVIDITSGRMLGAEVLVRWRKPDGTIARPDAFIELMESSGLIIDMTRALMREACREVGAAIGRHPDMYVAFNITPRHLADSIVLNDVASIFEGSPVPLSQVVLEVTERDEITKSWGCTAGHCRPAGAWLQGRPRRRRHRP